MVEIFQSRSVHLNRVAVKIPGRAKLLSTVRHLSRFLANPGARVREWYAPIAKKLLQSMAHTVGDIRLIADGTKVGFNHQLLSIAIAYRRRAIPIAWSWVRSARGHSSAWKQLALLSYGHKLVPSGTLILLVGDSEFGAVEVIRGSESYQTWPEASSRSG